jgi:hypothetical protein
VQKAFNRSERDRQPGGAMTDQTNHAVKALVAKWRKDSCMWHDDTFTDCADELEAALAVQSAEQPAPAVAGGADSYIEHLADWICEVDGYSRQNLIDCITGAFNDHEQGLAEGLAKAQARTVVLEAELGRQIQPTHADGQAPRGVETLAAKFHEIYQVEAKRQGAVRHKDAYADLPENIKEFDRVLARYVLNNLAEGQAALREALHNIFVAYDEWVDPDADFGSHRLDVAIDAAKAIAAAPASWN